MATETLDEAVSRIAAKLLDGKMARCEALREMAAWVYGDAAQYIDGLRAHSTNEAILVQWGISKELKERAQEAARG